MERAQHFDHQLSKHTKLLQKVAILRWRQESGQWQVLLLQRSATAMSRPSCWDLPGGNSEWPETLTESAANLHYQDICREVLEETGFSFKAEALSFADICYFSTYFNYSEQIYSMITGWQFDLTEVLEEQAIQLSGEHQQADWVNFSDLSRYDFGGSKGEFILEIIKYAFAKKQA